MIYGDAFGGAAPKTLIAILLKHGRPFMYFKHTNNSSLSCPAVGFHHGPVMRIGFSPFGVAVEEFCRVRLIGFFPSFLVLGAIAFVVGSVSFTSAGGSFFSVLGAPGPFSAESFFWILFSALALKGVYFFLPSLSTLREAFYAVDLQPVFSVFGFVKRTTSIARRACFTFSVFWHRVSLCKGSRAI